MKRVTGIGGIFFRCNDPASQNQWYKQHLGIETNQYGGKFIWRDPENPEKKCVTAWNTFKQDTKYFDPSEKQFMFNYRVENLVELMEELRKEGVQIVGNVEEYDYGKFAWIMDPEGNKLELWEPKDED